MEIKIFKMRLHLEFALRLWNLEVTTDLTNEKLIDLSMAWDSGGLLGLAIQVNRMICALPM